MVLSLTRHGLFRQMPNTLSIRYLAARGALQDSDLGVKYETKIDVLFDA